MASPNYDAVMGELGRLQASALRSVTRARSLSTEIRTLINDFLIRVVQCPAQLQQAVAQAQVVGDLTVAQRDALLQQMRVISAYINENNDIPDRILQELVPFMESWRVVLARLDGTNPPVNGPGPMLRWQAPGTPPVRVYGPPPVPPPPAGVGPPPAGLPIVRPYGPPRPPGGPVRPPGGSPRPSSGRFTLDSQFPVAGPTNLNPDDPIEWIDVMSGAKSQGRFVRMDSSKPNNAMVRDGSGEKSVPLTSVISLKPKTGGWKSPSPTRRRKKRTPTPKHKGGYRKSKRRTFR
jgi:hypothetical protein